MSAGRSGLRFWRMLRAVGFRVGHGGKTAAAAARTDEGGVDRFFRRHCFVFGVPRGQMFLHHGDKAAVVVADVGE